MGINLDLIYPARAAPLHAHVLKSIEKDHKKVKATFFARDFCKWQVTL
jgi:hypothetical protein